MGRIDSDVRKLSRRGFVTASLTAAGGLAIGVAMPRSAWAGLPVAAEPWADTVDTKGKEINAWLVIEPDETVLIRVAKSEMGEGIFTSLPMIVAEELHATGGRSRPSTRPPAATRRRTRSMAAWARAAAAPSAARASICSRRVPAPAPG